jgi:hypothetical protein
MSGYNQESQGGQTPRGHESHPPMPSRQGKLPDKDHLDGKTQEQLRKDNVLNEEKGLIHQLPGGESG